MKVVGPPDEFDNITPDPAALITHPAPDITLDAVTVDAAVTNRSSALYDPGVEPFRAIAITSPPLLGTKIMLVVPFPLETHVPFTVV